MISNENLRSQQLSWADYRFLALLSISHVSNTPREFGRAKARGFPVLLFWKERLPFSGQELSSHPL
jgi:hypothetical protein